MKKILLIEDNIELSNQIENYLKKNNYIVDVTFDMKSSLDALDNDYDLALLDINLPDGDGINLLDKLKGKHIKTIIMTVKNDDDFIVKTLDQGADDYITKPFSLSVLRARIDVSLRDVVITSEDFIKYKDFTLDENNIHVFFKDKKLDLTAKEYEILSVFIKNPNRIFTRDYLLDYFWDERENIVNDNTLTVTIKRLRKKTDRETIKTIRGIGYKMC